jgi:hypothetical protein
LHPFRFLGRHRYIRNTLLMVVVVLIVLPAALSDGHMRHVRPHERAQVAVADLHTGHSVVRPRRAHRHHN